VVFGDVIPRLRIKYSENALKLLKILNICMLRNCILDKNQRAIIIKCCGNTKCRSYYDRTKLSLSNATTNGLKRTTSVKTKKKIPVPVRTCNMQIFEQIIHSINIKTTPSRRGKTQQAIVSPTQNNNPAIVGENSSAVNNEKLPTTTRDVVSSADGGIYFTQTPANVPESTSSSFTSKIGSVHYKQIMP
jgi:hypothetical protein